ncbi:MAG: EAL domain-containing protein [Terracidiphilus sp.]|jgi:EAL domain-containing protein (putative c-di-GMP-specific phosphodiesterase class I)
MQGSATRQFSKGEALMREGERGECAYIIETGNVEILVQREGQLLQIGTRGPGSMLGEMAMIDDKPRTATVRALEDCTAIEITREDFAHRVESADPVLKMVMRIVTSRYRDMIARTDAVRVVPASPAAEAAEQSDSSSATALTTIRLNNELKEALEKGELTLFYQPIIDIQNMKIAGFEGLMRWRHPVNGMISPGVFIPVAEDSGLITELSQLALELASDAAIKLQAAASKDLIGPEPLFVGVNFSVKDFSAVDLPGILQAAIEQKQMNPLQIHLEIVESLLMDSPEKARAVLEKCRQIGINISIDDFGSGYSSLSYLHFFPIDTLKIDQSFIRTLSKDQGSKVLVKAIIGLAHNLGMKVIAEGVETAADAEYIRLQGCEYIQGYFFSKPLAFEAASEFVQKWQPPSF